nr:tyrosine-type recombinase/integrase [Burkholderia sp. AU30280]
MHLLNSGDRVLQPGIGNDAMFVVRVGRGRRRQLLNCDVALRHACATHMLENGADVRFIQALLSHADLNSTQIYTQVAIGKLKQVHAATHPARLGQDVAALLTVLADEDDDAAP